MDSQCLFKNCDFWTTGTKNGNSSWYWRKLLRLGSLLTPNVLTNATTTRGFRPAICYDNLSTTGVVFPGYRQI